MVPNELKQSSEQAESVTIAECVNALSTPIPQIHYIRTELYDSLPPKSLIENSAKGYMNNKFFKKTSDQIQKCWKVSFDI